MRGFLGLSERGWSETSETSQAHSRMKALWFQARYSTSLISIFFYLRRTKARTKAARSAVGSILDPLL